MVEAYKWFLPKIKLNKVQKQDGWDTKYLSINIVTIGQTNYLSKCLSTIYATIPENFPPSEVNIWENGSSQETQENVRQALMAAGQHPSFVAHFFPHNANIGFAAAHNKMVGLSAGRYLCMLNDDMEIFEQDWASKMIKQLSATTLQIGGFNQSVCNRLNSNGHGFCAPPHISEYCDGAFIMMNMEWARALGPWDTDLFRIAYCEDPDLSLRIRALGYSAKVMPINHIHHRAKTTSTIRDIDLDGFASINRIRLLARWGWYISKRDFWVRIAVVRAAAAGDTLMATSVISKIRELAPEAVIDVYTNFPAMFANNTKMDNCYLMNLWEQNRRKYHSVIMLNDAYERDTKELSYRAYYKVAGMHNEPIVPPEIYFSKGELEEADKIIAVHKNTYGDKPVAIFHTGKTNWLGRNLEIEKFEAVAGYLQEKGWSIVEVGGKETDKMVIESTKLQGEDISVRITMAIIGKADLFVGIDSFPWNVAQTCRVPSVVVFGCIDPKYRILDTKKTVAVQSLDKSCLGCHHEYLGPIHESQCMRKRSGYKNSPVAPCMEDINVGQLIEAVDKVLKENIAMSETAKIREKVVEYIKETEFGIDIGCGPDKLYKSSIGVDKYKTMVVDHVCDARELPFENGTLDYVFSSHCLEDFIDKENVLVEWCRVIKPGGKIALYLPHKDYYKGCNLDHYELFDSEYIKPILEVLGFKIDLDYLDIGDYNGAKDDRYSFLVIATKNV